MIILLIYYRRFFGRGEERVEKFIYSQNPAEINILRESGQFSGRCQRISTTLFAKKKKKKFALIIERFNFRKTLPFSNINIRLFEILPNSIFSVVTK